MVDAAVARVSMRSRSRPDIGDAPAVGSNDLWNGVFILNCPVVRLYRRGTRAPVVERYSMSIERDTERPRRERGAMNRSRRERFVNVFAKLLHNTSYTTRALSRVSSTRAVAPSTLRFYAAR